MIKLFIISILCTLIMFFILNILNNKFNFLSCNKYLLLSEIFIASIVIITIVNICHMLYGRDKFTTLQSYSINYQDKQYKIKIGQNLLDINSDKKI